MDFCGGDETFAKASKSTMTANDRTLKDMVIELIIMHLTKNSAFL